MLCVSRPISVRIPKTAEIRRPKTDHPSDLSIEQRQAIPGRIRRPARSAQRAEIRERRPGAQRQEQRPPAEMLHQDTGRRNREPRTAPGDQRAPISEQQLMVYARARAIHYKQGEGRGVARAPAWFYTTFAPQFWQNFRSFFGLFSGFYVNGYLTTKVPVIV